MIKTIDLGGFNMKIEFTINNMENSQITECCAQVTSVGRVISVSLRNEDFYRSPDEYKLLTKALKSCVEEDLQEYHKFLLNHPEMFNKERQYLWIPKYYGRILLSGEMKTISQHSLSDAEYKEYMEQRNPFVIEIGR